MTKNNENICGQVLNLLYNGYINKIHQKKGGEENGKEN
jgi:hypothetical protein